MRHRAAPTAVSPPTSPDSEFCTKCGDALPFHEVRAGQPSWWQALPWVVRAAVWVVAATILVPWMLWVLVVFGGAGRPMLSGAGQFGGRGNLAHRHTRGHGVDWEHALRGESRWHAKVIRTGDCWNGRRIPASGGFVTSGQIGASIWSAAAARAMLARLLLGARPRSPMGLGARLTATECTRRARATYSRGADGPTLGAFAQQWLEERAPHLTPQVAYNYRGLVTNHLLPHRLARMTLGKSATATSQPW
jgi:hypothetical protein